MRQLLTHVPYLTFLMESWWSESVSLEFIMGLLCKSNDCDCLWKGTACGSINHNANSLIYHAYVFRTFFNYVLAI